MSIKVVNPLPTLEIKKSLGIDNGIASDYTKVLVYKPEKLNS